MKPRRVAVTGMGLMTPIGNSPQMFFEKLVAGKTGIGSRPDSPVTQPVGRVDYDLSRHFTALQLTDMDRVSLLSLMAAQQALDMSGLAAQGALGETAGVFFGTGAGCIGSVEQAYAGYFGTGRRQSQVLPILSAMAHAPASQVALRYGIKGESQTYSIGCSSSAVAIGEAFRRIRDGYLDSAVAGGGESMLTPGVMQSWQGMRVLCKDPADAPGTGCRPFSADRSGFALGEGAGFVVLEELEQARARGAEVIAELAGYGVSNDACHLSRPQIQGQVLAMQRALEAGHIRPGRIGYINANGIGTHAGDVAETRAIKYVFGRRAYKIPVSSTKSAHGHLVGAAGAVEFIAALMALCRQVVPPTTHWTSPDADCDLDYVPHTGRPVRGLDHVMSNSFAFGGTNASLVARRLDA